MISSGEKERVLSILLLHYILPWVNWIDPTKKGGDENIEYRSGFADLEDKVHKREETH